MKISGKLFFLNETTYAVTLVKIASFKEKIY